MSNLRLLTLGFLAAASAYSLAVIWRAHPELARETAQAMAALDRSVMTPALEQLRRQDAALIDSLDDRPTASFRLAIRPLQPGELRTLPHVDHPPAPPRAVVADDDRVGGSDDMASANLTILPDLSPEAAPVPPAPTMPEPKLATPRVPASGIPDFQVADGKATKNQVASAIPEPPPFAQVPAAPHSRAEAAALRLRTSLTPELAQNFDLFIFVSKAERGPLAQRMYVFRRQEGGLKLVYDWAASTGREQDEISPRGRKSFTATPAGFYQLDPDRMYRRYRSYNWDQDMPHAMFFNWTREGVQTGLAIHSASGDDIARLGHRASAGCVHLSPENAATLFALIKADYRGPAPRFAVNRATDTMSNTGALMHGRDGNLRMADGYRVLIDIENYSGADGLAALN